MSAAVNIPFAVALCASLGLAACAGTASPALVQDPVPGSMRAASLTVHDPIPPPITKDVVIELHIDTYLDFQNACEAMGMSLVAGCTNLPRLEKTGICEVHLQAYDAQPERWAILGERLHHEADHCLLGAWHR